MANIIPVSAEKYKFALHEDWAVVVLGFVIILISISGLIIPVPSYSWKNGIELMDKVLTLNNLLSIGAQFLFVFIFSVLAAALTNKPIKNSVLVFPVVYVLTVVALILAGNSEVKALNLEAVIFSLGIGLLVGNLFHLPEWFRAALSTELFVKIGLVLLGTGIIFSDILKAGSLGLLQALIVVLSVWYFAYWICKRLKIDEELTMMISSAVSICGVSAAIATA